MAIVTEYFGIKCRPTPVIITRITNESTEELMIHINFPISVAHLNMNCIARIVSESRGLAKWGRGIEFSATRTIARNKLGL